MVYDMKSTLAVFIGYPASGKTTLRREMLRDEEIDEVVSADDIRFHKYKTQFDPAIESQVWSIVKSRLGDCLSDGKRCLLDATNLDPERRKDLIAIADDFDAETEAIVLNMDFDVAMVRNRRDPIAVDGQMIHQTVPDAAMYRMERMWKSSGLGHTESSIKEALEDEFDEISVINRYADKKDCDELGGQLIQSKPFSMCLLTQNDDLSVTRKQLRVE